MAAKRKFKVRVRGKVRNRLLRRGGAAAGLALGLLLSAWIFNLAARNYSRLAGDRLQFKPDSFDVDCPSEEAELSIRKLAALAEKKPLGAGAAAELARRIKSLHPALSSVEVSRNFLTRKASITAVPEETVAAVLADGATRYLGVTGRFMPETLSAPGEEPFAVELQHSPGAAPEFAAFVTELKPLAGTLYSPPVSLSCDARSWDCRLKLGDGSAVLWGKFEFTRLKVLRLNEVMGDALAKSGGPLRADLRSFNEGKIFVSALER